MRSRLARALMLAGSLGAVLLGGGAGVHLL